MSRKRYKKKKSQLDVVLLTRNLWDIAQQCVDAVPEACEGLDYQFIIFDNDSDQKEKKIEFYNQFPDDVKIYYSQQNLGYPKGFNEAVRKGTSPYVLILTNDVILRPQSITTLMKTMEDEKVGMAGMKLIFPEDSNDPARPAGKLQHICLTTNVRGEFYHPFLGWNPNHPKINKLQEVYAVTGAVFLIRRELWNKVGGFFDGYGRGTFEDVDLAMKIHEMGYNVVTEPKAVATHYVGATAMEMNQPFPLEQNRMIFLQRWGSKLKYDEWRVL